MMRGDEHYAETIGTIIAWHEDDLNAPYDTIGAYRIRYRRGEPWPRGWEYVGYGDYCRICRAARHPH